MKIGKTRARTAPHCPQAVLFNSPAPSSPPPYTIQQLTRPVSPPLSPNSCFIFAPSPLSPSPLHLKACCLLLLACASAQETFAPTMVGDVTNEMDSDSIGMRFKEQPQVEEPVRPCHKVGALSYFLKRWRSRRT